MYVWQVSQKMITNEFFIEMIQSDSSDHSASMKMEKWNGWKAAEMINFKNQF